MDTTSKILSPDSALSMKPPQPLVLVAGLFDILRESHVDYLVAVRAHTSAATLIAIVLPDDGAVLEQRARAELVAAMRMIDYVVAATDADLDRIAGTLHPAAVVRLEDADRQRVRQLIEHVHSRQAR